MYSKNILFLVEFLLPFRFVVLVRPQSGCPNGHDRKHLLGLALVTKKYHYLDSTTLKNTKCRLSHFLFSRCTQHIGDFYPFYDVFRIFPLFN